jgi:hypothetical protein
VSAIQRVVPSAGIVVTVGVMLKVEFNLVGGWIDTVLVLLHVAVEPIHTLLGDLTSEKVVI